MFTHRPRTYLNIAGIQPAPPPAPPPPPPPAGEAGAAAPLPALARDTRKVVNAPTTAPSSTSDVIKPGDADAPWELLAAVASAGVFVV